MKNLNPHIRDFRPIIIYKEKRFKGSGCQFDYLPGWSISMIKEVECLEQSGAFAPKSAE
jgi:hypothetical protein